VVACSFRIVTKSLNGCLEVFMALMIMCKENVFGMSWLAI
jgi:hypothetical protein